MKNKYGLPEVELDKIRKRDKTCVYCHKILIRTNNNDDRRKDWATIEHLNHLPPWDNIETVAICCGSCNSSRGNKTLLDWFKTKYCIDKKISNGTVANPVKVYLSAYA